MFERGFKSWCENVSLQMRREVSLKRTDPLPADALATYMEVQLLTPRDIPRVPAQTLDVLTRSERFSWYALAVSADGHDAVIYNPAQSAGRRSSDIMHELSHLLIGHAPSTVLLTPDGETALRTFDRQQEDEANWLAGCLLLPRPALIHIVQSGWAHEDALERYFVSQDLLDFRLNVTGVRSQMRRNQHKSSA